VDLYAETEFRLNPSDLIYGNKVMDPNIKSFEHFFFARHNGKSTFDSYRFNFEIATSAFVNKNGKTY